MRGQCRQNSGLDHGSSNLRNMKVKTTAINEERQPRLADEWIHRDKYCYYYLRLLEKTRCQSASGYMSIVLKYIIKNTTIVNPIF